MENVDNTPKPPKFLQIGKIDEVHQIIEKLWGKNGKSEGDFRAKHLATILQYLQSKKREDKGITLAKLALIVGMSQRQIRENYFDGMLAFGIIELDNKCMEWYWVGLSALITKEGELQK